MIIENYHNFHHYGYVSRYAVRAYDRYGNGLACYYCDSFEEAEQIRKEHAEKIGLEPEPTYKDFVYYPTIWVWKSIEYRYERILGY